MTFVYDWITKIVLFMLIGTIIEMLLPSNTMKKYVHFVFGLLFLLLLAQPIFYIFQTDITEQISHIEEHLQTNEGHMEQTKLNIEKQKEDIQAEQAAYIWNELAEQYMDVANPILQNDFQIHISTLAFVPDSDGDVMELTFSSVIVSLEEFTGQSHSVVTAITPIKIAEQSNETSSVHKTNNRLIEQTLRQMWQLEDDITIELQWEGGTM